MKKLILILLIGLFQFNFSMTAKEYSDLGLKAYKSKDYEKAINNFYLAVRESKNEDNMTKEKKSTSLF